MKTDYQLGDFVLGCMPGEDASQLRGCMIVGITCTSGVRIYTLSDGITDFDTYLIRPLYNGYVNFRIP